jgi:hypothetical protein
LSAAKAENQLKTALMRDADFDVGEAFRQLGSGNEITRDDLIDRLSGDLDQPHIDILYAKLSAQSATKTVAYADFIECITPKGQKYF